MNRRNNIWIARIKEEQATALPSIATNVLRRGVVQDLDVGEGDRRCTPHPNTAADARPAACRLGDRVALDCAVGHRKQSSAAYRVINRDPAAVAGRGGGVADHD